MKLQKESLKIRVLVGLTGFLLGEFLIGGIVWIAMGVITKQWDSMDRIRLYLGIFFGILGFILGTKFLIPLFALIARFEGEQTEDGE